MGDQYKALYAMRWGVETSFRELKYTVGLRYFHSKRYRCVLQEIWTRLIMYNFAAFITDREPVRVKGKKHAYRANFSVAVTVCRWFFNGWIKADAIEPHLRRYVSPVRPDRSSPRRLREKTPVSFTYRLA